jgi:hypothetical protein
MNVELQLKAYWTIELEMCVKFCTDLPQSCSYPLGNDKVLRNGAHPKFYTTLSTIPYRRFC